MEMSNFDLEEILNKLIKEEEEVLILKGKVDTLRTNILEKKECITSQAEITNTKLKHRIAILKHAIAEEKANQTTNKNENMVLKGIQDALINVFSEAVSNSYPEVNINIPLTQSSRPQFGDYQCNAAMPIANTLKSKGVKTSPKEVATNILQNLKPSEIIDKVEIAPPGFLNIWLSKAFCKNELIMLIRDGVKPPPIDRKLRVIVDFSSPNIAKQMHVGHLRSTVIGDSICRLLEFIGHSVLRINHVGDWGTQFGMLIAHLQEKFPNYLNESPPIADLQGFYKESKARFDNEPEFKTKAYECVVKLQSLEPDYIKAWNLICDVSRKEFQIVYDKLEINLIERGESFYQSHMQKIVKELEEKKFLIEDEGRKVLFGQEEGSIPMTIVKSDGGFTYDTSDLAAIKQRIEEEKANWLIYVTDSGQAVHFKILLSCAEKVGIWERDLVRVDHVPFGVVLGEDKKKFKTRSGESIQLNELLEEGVRRAEETLRAKNRHTVLSDQEFEAAKQSVAYGCIKYADLSHNRINDYVFSFDKMLEDKGNTAVYLLYALTRIRSIARNANVSNEDLKKAASEGSLAIDHEKEWKLVKTLLRFHDVLIKITQDLLLHHLCEFLYDVAITFTEFYDNCYCIEKDPKTGNIVKIHMDRLILCEATALTMEKCFHILGLKPLSRM